MAAASDSSEAMEWPARKASTWGIIARMPVARGANPSQRSSGFSQIERLHLSCRRLIWINPLLRWTGFAPKATGIRAMLPHVDCFRAGHSIASLEALGRAVSTAGDSGEKQRLLRLMAP